MAGDTAYPNVTLLLHGNGSNGGTTFTDNSGTPKTATVVGTPVTSTTQSLFGGASIRVSHVDKLVFADSGIASLGSSDFTIEFWVSMEAAATGWYFTNSLAGNANASFLIYSDDIGNVVAQAYRSTGAVVGGAYSEASGPFPGGSAHVAYVRSGTSFKLYIDGVVAASATSSAALNTSPSGDIYIYGQNAAEDGGAKVYFDEVRITVGTARYTADFTPPTAAHPDGIAIGAHIAVPGPLGGERVLATFAGFVTAARISAPGPLGAVAALAYNDFSGVVGSLVAYSVLELATPTGPVRVPISSWQATLQTTDANYVQCVVPACTAWTDALNAATEFVIYRRATLTTGGTIDYEMARAPASQLSFDRGPERNTCTLSGYSPGFAEDLDPPATYDRPLVGVRSISRSAGSIRVRCAVDWLLRPGHRAYVEGAPFVVGYINYYAPTGFDAYMDIGSR